MYLLKFHFFEWKGPIKKRLNTVLAGLAGLVDQPSGEEAPYTRSTGVGEHVVTIYVTGETTTVDGMTGPIVIGKLTDSAEKLLLTFKCIILDRYPFRRLATDPAFPGAKIFGAS